MEADFQTKQSALLVDFRTAMHTDPHVALDILLKNYDCEVFCQCLEILNEAPLHISTMLVVCELALKTVLPELYIVHYILSCIQTCQPIHAKSEQRRSVRLLCVFIKKLVSLQLVTDWRLFHEICSFCSQFSSIYEAKDLLEYLKAEFLV